MALKVAIALGLAAALAAIPSVSQPAQASGPLDLRVTECASRKSVTLRDALGQLGACVSGGYVLFGLEETLRDGKQPVVDLDVKPGATVGTALKQIIRRLPPYEIEVVSGHLVNLLPKGAKKDPENPMNLRIPSCNFEDVGLDTVLGAPRDVIPALDRALTPKPEPGKRVIRLYVQGFNPSATPVTLHLKNVTVRDILNAAALASEKSFSHSAPLGWVYTFDPAKPLTSGYRYTWATLNSLPYGWKDRMRKAEVPSTH